MSASVPARAALRLLASTFGGWVFAVGQTALGAVLVTRAGYLPLGDATRLFEFLAFPIFTAVLLWSFAARSERVWCGLIGAGALMTALAWVLARRGA